MPADNLEDGPPPLSLRDSEGSEVEPIRPIDDAANLPSRTAARPRAIKQWPVTVIAWLMIGGVLYIGKAAFAPIMFAILLAMLLSPLVDFLERHRTPRGLASMVVVGALIGIMTLIIDAAWSPTLRWVDDAPAVLQKVEQKIRPLQKIVARVQSVTTRASTLTNVATNGKPQTAPTPTDAGVNALDASRTILIDLATVSILTVFLLVAGGRTLRSIEQALMGYTQRYQCMMIVNAVRSELSRYYLTLTLINVGLGLATTGMVALWDLPNPWLWGTMAGLLNFFPYVGPTITLSILSVVSLVSYEGYGTAIGVAGSFLFIATIEGQIVQPLLVGFRLNLNPIILFLAIWFAGWFWGVAGIILATPVLITLKEIANQQIEPSVLKAVLSGKNKPLFSSRIPATSGTPREKQFPL